MAGKDDPILKLLLFGCAGLAGLGVFIAATGGDFGFILIMLSMAIATAPLFHFAMKWPLKDSEKEVGEEEDSERGS